MKLVTDVPVLIIAYRREDTLIKILNICAENNVNKIYISIDGPRANAHALINEQKKMLNSINKFGKDYEGEVIVQKRNTNLGCAASVLSACAWIFQTEAAAIILEDDCIPSKGFFDFSRITLPIIELSQDIWLSCGTQFSPKEKSSDSWYLSRYALTWGWVTTKTKWVEIINSFIEPRIKPGFKLSIWENSYWNYGARRARIGWVDAWDTILVQQMQKHSKYAILPDVPLISNTGNDFTATHTIGKSPWLNLEIQEFKSPLNYPQHSIFVEKWLRRNFFCIKPRHFFSTKLTFLKDITMQYLKPRTDLKTRLELF